MDKTPENPEGEQPPGNQEPVGGEFEVQRALQAAEQRFRAVVDRSVDGIMILTPEGIIAFANSAAAHLLGSCTASLRGQPFGVPLVHDGPELPARGLTPEGTPVGPPTANRRPAEEISMCGLSRMAATGQTEPSSEQKDILDLRVPSPTKTEGEESTSPVDPSPIATGSAEIHIRGKDGTVRNVELHVAEAEWQDQPAYLVTLRDVTALRDEVRKRDEFLAMLSHELRNPLCALMGAFQLMQQSRFDPCVIARAGNVVERQLCHTTKMLDDLLDICRISKGTFKIDRQVLDIIPLIEEAIAYIQPIARQRRHELIVQMPRAQILVLGDATRLQQVWTNLLSNACKYTPPKGRIRLMVHTETAQVIVRVKDNGRGIQTDLQPCIFEPFIQGKQTLARPEGGLGIGLTLVYRIIRLHQGTIEVESAGEGLGSEFIVRLPLCESDRINPPTRPCAPPKGSPKHPGSVPELPSLGCSRESNATQGNPTTSRPDRLGWCGSAVDEKRSPGPMRNPRIVLIEDHEDARRMLEHLLRSDGYEVVSAGDGVRGLELILREHPDVALIDLGLPGLNGFQVARRVREHAENREMRLIALTGYNRPEDRQRALAVGFDLHLAKPVAYEDLTCWIRQDSMRA